MTDKINVNDMINSDIDPQNKEIKAFMIELKPCTNSHIVSLTGDSINDPSD